MTIRQRIWAWTKEWWDEVLCAFVLLTIGLFLLGYDLFGLSGPLSSLMAFLIAILAAVLGFIMAALILPMVGLISGFFVALGGAVTLLVGTFITPLVALLTGAVSSLITWLAGTWLGTLLTPLYNMIWPILGKITPWITVGRGGKQILAFLERHPALLRAIPALGVWMEEMRLIEKQKTKRAAAKKAPIRKKP